MSTASSTAYADDIQVLEGLEPVRSGRPCTSAASTPRGCTTSSGKSSTTPSTSTSTATPITSPSRCTRTATAITVADNGRGIPVDMHPKYKNQRPRTRAHHAARRRQVRRQRQQLLPLRRPARRRRVGRQRPLEEARSPPSSATASNSSRRTRRACRTAKLEKVGPFRGHGTSIYFEPDDTIFKTTHFDADTIKRPPRRHVATSTAA